MSHILSVSMALESIDSCALLMERLLYTHNRERIIRNNLIRDAADSGVKQTVLMRRARLSRQQITTIVNSGAEVVPPEWSER